MPKPVNLNLDRRGQVAALAWLERDENRWLAWRLTALIAAGALFYGVDWTGLSLWVAKGVAGGLTLTGLPSSVEILDHRVELIAGEMRFWIDGECTYVDLFLCAAPFLWRPRKSWRVNLGRLVLAAVVVHAVNFVRLVVCHQALVHGVARFWAHDLPDMLMWYPAMAMAVVLAVRSDQSATPTE